MANIHDQYLPEKGTIFNLFERLEKYILVIDETWKFRIKPTNELKICKLKEVSGLNKLGLDLPEVYKVFLNYLGEDDGGILGEFFLGDACIDAIIDVYNDYHEYNPKLLNPFHLIIVLNEMGDEIKMDMQNPENPKILGLDNTLQAECFEKLLFQCAFCKFEQHLYPIIYRFGGTKSKISETLGQECYSSILSFVDDYAKQFGLEKAWFSDALNYCAHKKGLSFHISSHNGAVVGTIMGEDENLIKAFSKLLVNELGVRIQEEIRK